MDFVSFKTRLLIVCFTGIKCNNKKRDNLVNFFIKTYVTGAHCNHLNGDSKLMTLFTILAYCILSV